MSWNSANFKFPRLQKTVLEAALLLEPRDPAFFLQVFTQTTQSEHTVQLVCFEASDQVILRQRGNVSMVCETFSKPELFLPHYYFCQKPNTCQQRHCLVYRLYSNL